MKFGQLIEYNKGNVFFLEIMLKIWKGSLPVPDLLFYLKKFYMS